MIPLTDHNPRSTTPVVNNLLIGINVLVFLWELSLGPYLARTLFAMAFIPARFWYAPLYPLNWASILLSMFLHGGWLHIGGNMLYLWIFGDNIEDRLGHGKYALFYLLCGFLATISHAVFNASSTVPSIGASGAIAGVLGAYLVLFPKAQVKTLIPVFFFIFIRDIPAVIVLGLWFILQLFVGVASIGPAAQNAGGVAYFAHIGGFISGMVLVVLMGGMRPRRPPARDPLDEIWR
ncbi:MAG TPA: rhomboid family intramembrane serine protease [Thermoanaerobaculia bacterium]|jgi:membrane associated rhomboid family serine protease|nr:rhomboid family intramembrane serine protease [Thermoanaerobaculia bacterium]